LGRLLDVIGLLLLGIGLFCALLGPIEMYCFYLFSEGGRFYYEGFGFGSFLFGLIAVQIMGYYVLAFLLIPLGYGHLRKRRWARTLSLTVFWTWLVVGIPLALLCLFILLSAKELTVGAALAFVVLMAASYLILPWLLIKFYNSKNIRRTFESRDPNTYWTEDLPQPVLVMGALLLFYTISLHIPIFFRGIFPLFGTLVSDLEGFLLISFSILWLVFLLWGTLQRKAWAWWGAMAYFLLLTLSTLRTLWPASLPDILAVQRFPPTEMEALQNIPLQGSHLAMLIGLPLLLTLVAILLSRPHFRTTTSTASDEHRPSTPSAKSKPNQEVTS
jgi:hypothetical protein